jgi:hypothetical protein
MPIPNQPTYADILALALQLPAEEQRRLVAALNAGLAQVAEAVASAATRPARPGLRILANGLDPAGRLLPAPDPAAVLQLVRAGEPAFEATIHTERAAADAGVLGLVHGISDDELSQAGWALVVNAADDSALIKALTPLIEQRAAVQGLRLPPLDFRPGENCSRWLARHVPDFNHPLDRAADRQVPVLTYRPGERTSAWLERHGVAARAVDPALGVPFYLCLAGRPGPLAPGDKTAIPFELQYQLDIFWGVGRLCFTDLAGVHVYADYTSYAERIVAHEQHPVPRARHIAYFGSEHPEDDATRTSALELLRPLHAGRPSSLSAAERFGFSQELRLAEQAHHSDLSAILRGETSAGPPALLLSATHGLGFAADDPLLAANQGALVCQDWPGSGAVRREHWFAAEDLDARCRVEGLIALSIACYGLGCPAEDQFTWPGAGEARRIAPHALIAQLPQALLRRGALAVFGHVDRAWSYAFQSQAGPAAPATRRIAAAQVQAFDDLLRRLMDGKRIGFATDQFNAQQGAVAVELSDLLAQAARSSDPDQLAFEIGLAWVVRNDLRNYAVLGDPAVRLGVGR